MPASISYPETPSSPLNANETHGASRLRTVTGNRFPRKCACKCGNTIPRDPEIVYVVDFGHAKPYPAYLREHSPDYGTFHGQPRSQENATTLPAFRPASDLPRVPPKPPVAPRLLV